MAKTAAPNPFTRIILESQSLGFSVADEIRIRQHKAPDIREFSPKRNKKASHPVGDVRHGSLPAKAGSAYMHGTRSRRPP
jgi:hypothetical protein